MNTTPRSPRNNASEEETSGSADKPKKRRSKDVFKPPTPENSSPD
jgi:hypothetical protein